MLVNYKPAYTATVVERLTQAGGVMLGKTNMDEFSMGTSSTSGAFGPCKNPWTTVTHPEVDLAADWLLPGGSSGGSAVAVACGLAKIALGSDTGGSARNPAAMCGVVGLKPSYGLMSRYGLIPLVNSLDTPSILTGNVDDAAWALDLMSGLDKKDPMTVDRPLHSFQSLDPCVKGLTIGIPKEYNSVELSGELYDCWRAVAVLLAEHGAHVTTVTLPHTHWSIRCYHVLGECDVASNMARFDGVEFGHRAKEEYESVDALYAASRSQAFHQVVRRRVLAGNYFLMRQHYSKYFEQALRVRRLIAEDHYRLFRPEQYNESVDSKVDILLTPVLSATAPLHSEFVSGHGQGYIRERNDDLFTQAANMAGVPAISVPVARSVDNKPMSVQLVADWMDDRRLLSVARFIERNVQFQSLNVNKELLHMDECEHKTKS